MVMRLDQESGFTSKAFWDLAVLHGIELRFSGSQSHNLIRSGETYHEPLRRVFRILRERHPNVEPELILQYAMNGLKYSIESNGLVPSLLVFGTLPSFPLITTIKLPNQEERLEMMRLTWEEVATIRAEQRVVAVSKANLLPSEKYKIRSRDTGLSYSEKGRKWIQEQQTLEIKGK